MDARYEKKAVFLGYCTIIKPLTGYDGGVVSALIQK